MRVKPTVDDLNLLSEHLCYEVDMTYGSTELMRHGMAWNAHPVSRNAVLEAFTIHLRQLIDFFWPEGPRRAGSAGKTPDALASDFFEKGEWDRLRPERPDILSKAIRSKVGWGVAHLTYGRAWAKPEDGAWEFDALARALAPAVIAFVDNLEPGKLRPEHVEQMKMHGEVWGGRGGDHEAMRYLATSTSS